MTRSEHLVGNGARGPEVAASIPGDAEEVFVNVQGDEPLVEPEAIDTSWSRPLNRKKVFRVATLMVLHRKTRRYQWTPTL